MEVKSWIRIRTETNADEQHWLERCGGGGGLFVLGTKGESKSVEVYR
jgi:hypothetical protein